MAYHWPWAWQVLPPDPYKKKRFSHRTSQAGRGAPSPSWDAVSLARASFVGFGGGTGETQSEESVIRFKGSGFVWSLCYLTALKLYNAKQVPFFFIYGSYIYPFIIAIYFSNLTADNTENSLLAKNFIFHTLQDNNFRIKGKKYIYIYMQKYPYLFLAPELIPHTEYRFGV